jgi:GNAT superfamily N-acetyltransferase
MRASSGSSNVNPSGRSRTATVVRLNALVHDADERDLHTVDRSSPRHAPGWIEEQLRRMGIDGRGRGRPIIEIASPRTRDVRTLAETVAELPRDSAAVTEALITAAMEAVVRQRHADYEEDWKPLTKVQQNVLRAVAAQRAGLARADVSRRFGVREASTITKTVDALCVRPATADDSSTLARLNVAVQELRAQLVPALFKPPGVNTFDAAAMTQLLALPGTIMMIAFVDDIPAGYAYAEVRQRSETPYSRASRDVFIHHICVEFPFRRSGVGSALLEALAAEGRRLNIERLATEVWCANGPAVAFFGAHGLVPYSQKLGRGAWDVRPDTGRADP